MTQADIMDYLDKHPDKFFSAADLCKIFKDQMNRMTVYNAVRKIIKRHEYHAVIIKVNGLVTALYGRKK